ncbi:MAG TPA: POTRA domain-containing protein, partial [Saprospiraceae bacterium]|nr:POTRA domain-containing protein [Saprospiraceae bacterium]
MTHLLALLLFASPLAAVAQKADTLLPIISYGEPKEYEIGGVRVSGTQYADPGALISISGFRVGEKVRIPGSAFSKAVQNLWALKLFTDVQIIRERTQGEVVFLEIAVKEMPRYTRHSFVGVKKSKHDDLNGIVNKFIQKGAILTENAKATLVYHLEEHYLEKGYRNVKVVAKVLPDERATNAVRVEFDIRPGKRVKIQDIQFSGNEHVKDRTLRKKMKDTVRKRRLFKKSKLVRELYDDDKRKIEAYYNTLGFRDARVTKDSIWRNKRGRIMIHMDISEGDRYFFRNIVWKGNTI